MIEQVLAGLSLSGQLLLVKLSQIGLTVILAIVALRIAQLAANRFGRQIEQSAEDPARQARLKTLVGAGLNTARAIIVALAALMILGELGVDLTPVLASVGVVTLAVSLGAQTIIKDFIGGLLVLIENQYRVGDTVQIAAVTGQVEQITLRATYVREASGRLVLVPNGDVRVVANASQGWALVTIDLSLPLDADIEQARRVLQASLEQAKADPVLSPFLLEPASGGILARPQRAGGANPADRQDDARQAVRCGEDAATTGARRVDPGRPRAGQGMSLTHEQST